jgi:hypothetical protein
MFHLQRTWIFYLLALLIGISFAELGYKKLKRTFGIKSSLSSVFVILTSILVVFSTILLTLANAINHRGETVPYWSVCLFEDLTTNILFSALTISILASLGLTQISWGNIHLTFYRNTKKRYPIYVTGLLQLTSGIILLLSLFPIYMNLF